MNLMGQSASVITKNKLPGSYSTKIEFQGMAVVEEKINGQNAKRVQMGQAPAEGKPGDPIFEDLKSRVAIIEQLDYSSLGYKLELVGAEEIDGAACYKINVTKPDKKVITQFYDMKTNLLKRMVMVVDEKAPPVTQDYTDYKEIAGVMMPHTVTSSGLMPMPVTMTITDIKVNVDIPDADFK
jgi:hypothetical protein